MTKNKSGGTSARKKFASISRIISNVQLLPGEADADIEILRGEILRELDPGTPYEEYLAEEIMQRILEAKRLRELRQTLLRTALKAKVCAILGLPLDDPGDGSSEADLYERIMSDTHNGSSIEALDTELAEYKASLHSIQLSAYQDVSDEIEVMDRRLDLLERKLRQLRQSLDAMQADRRRGPGRAAS